MLKRPRGRRVPTSPARQEVPTMGHITSLQQFHPEMREFDRKHGPEDYYTRRLREKSEAEERERKKRKAERQREERQQTAAANTAAVNSSGQTWWEWTDERILAHEHENNRAM